MARGSEGTDSGACRASVLQFELEGLGAPLGDVTVQHGSLGEAHVVLAVDQDHRVGPARDTDGTQAEEDTLQPPSWSLGL